MVAACASPHAANFESKTSTSIRGLVIVRRGKGDQDRSTLLAELGRDELRTQLKQSEIQHQADRKAGLAGVWLPDALDRMCSWS